MPQPHDSRRKLIWDRHTRLFHWLLVIAFGVALLTGLDGGLDAMEWHMRAGYALAGLLVFRLLTGLFGGDYGHFRHFPLGPGQALAYLRGQRRFAGHNPLGSWMVVMLLLGIALQVGTGLMTSDGIFLEGPWVFAVSDDASRWASRIHKINYYVLGALVAIHIAAVAVHWLWRRDNLLAPMITGYKSLPVAMAAARRRGWLWLAAMAFIAAGLAWALISLP